MSAKSAPLGARVEGLVVNNLIYYITYEMYYILTVCF